MKKFTLLFLSIILTSIFAFAWEGGTLTSNPSPIVPNQSVVISYDGAGTNFVNWTPKCYVHIWLNPKSGQTFSKAYGTAWVNIIGDAAYDALDNKIKMTHDGVDNSGKYSMTISSLFDYFSVEEVDKSKIGELGIIVKTQYVGENENGNRTNDLMLTVTNPTTSSTVSVSENVQLTTTNGEINARFDGTAEIRLYTFSGQLLRSAVVSNQFVEVVKPGLYLLRMNDLTYKLMVK
jgi:hypothetical protein